MATRLLALLGALLTPWLVGCADPGAPLAEAIPAEFKSWATQRASQEQYVVRGHSPYAVQVCLADEERRLHGPETLLVSARPGEPGRARIELVIRGWPAELIPSAGVYRVFALPADYRRSDWRTLRASEPLAAGRLEPDAAGQVASQISVPRGGAARYLVSTLLETEAGFLCPGPREVSLPGATSTLEVAGEDAEQD